jgi:hypothetical protein
VKKRMPSYLIIPKDAVKAKIGRSPDRAEAFVLSLFGAPAQPTIPAIAAIGLGGTQTWRV